MMYNDERYEMTTMNRPRSVPHTPGLLATLRAAFLLLVALLFLLNLQNASSQQIDTGPVLSESFGLLPHHIDRGIDRVPLDSLTRHRVDSLRTEYRTGREGTQSEIATLRQQMLQQLHTDDRQGLDTTRRRVRNLMSALRESSDRYGRDIAALLHPDQVALLLDMTFVWGDESEQPDESIAAPVGVDRSVVDEPGPQGSGTDSSGIGGSGETAETSANAAASDPVTRPVPDIRSPSGVATTVRAGSAGDRAQPASP